MFQNLTGMAAGATNLISLFFPPLGEAYSQKTWSILPNRLPDIGTLIHMKWRGGIDVETFYDACRKQGLDDGWVNQVVSATSQILGAADAFEAWRRGIIGIEERNEYLGKQGISGHLIPQMEKLTYTYPNASDLITFARRDVFDPATVKFFGYEENLPSIPDSYLKAAGLTPEVWMLHWKAHWRDIEFNMASEMLHRGKINDSEFDLMLRAANYPPGIVENMKAISYSPLTRVDARRMYRLGTLKEDGLFKAYKDIGYSDENAQLMVEFTKKYESGEDRGITRAAVQTAYKKGLIDQDEFITYLAALDYPETTVAFWVEMTEFDMMQEEVDTKIDDITMLYSMGELDLEQVKIELDKLGLAAELAQRIQLKLQSKTSSKLKLPSQSDLTDWLRAGIIDQIAFGHRMKALGYKSEDIILFLTEAQEVTDITKRKFLAIKHYQELLTADIIDERYFRTALAEQEVTPEDIDALIIQVEEKIQSGLEAKARKASGDADSAGESITEPISEN